MPPTYHKKVLRYRSPIEKGICWFWFARYIRARDAKRWGACISCGRTKTYEELQAGHFAPAGDCGAALLMDEVNVNGECNHCNAFDAMHLLGYARRLDIRYGQGTAESLERRRVESMSNPTKEPSRHEYLERAARYRSLCEGLLSTDGELVTGE